MQEWVELAARAVEAVGVITILAGTIVSLILVSMRAGWDLRLWYLLYRRFLGHAILLGLEFLVAADIIRTVSHIPSIENVLTLAMIVLIRTFLSFTLEVELEGRWPWQSSSRRAPKDS
ncbi:DUF1622 domain-containing protein [Vulgatibacter sp.]|uniref:DUF1622 domain-containing protein n=1 Tax=Vulgatibacter sp. TaxID=1971226 RepID=UPI0035627A2A